MRKKAISLLLALVCTASLLCGAAMPASAVQEPAETPAASAEPSAAPSPEPSAAPSPEPSPAPSEAPKPSGPWYQQAMEYAVSNGILQGYSDGSLRPNGSATRAEMATMLVRIFSCMQEKSLAHFPDLQQGWYVHALSVAAEMGIFKGDTDGMMRPNARITREEAFAVLARAFAVPKGDVQSLSRFADASSVASWARAELAGLVESGVIQGSGGRLNPRAQITRAEVAQVFANLGMVFFSEPAELPETGRAVYNGTAALDLGAFSGTLYLGGGCGGSVTLTGESDGADVVVRTDPGTAVTLDGKAASVRICARGSLLTGAGYAGTVQVCARDCRAELACGRTETDYDAGLAGVTTLQTDKIAALTPEKRKTDLYITYQNVDLTGASTAGRDCTIRWYIDGEQQPLRRLRLQSGTTPGFSVSKQVWRRYMNSTVSVKVQLLYGTDVVTTEFTVPVQNYTDAEYAQLLRAGKPYQLEVVRNQCTVLVYGLDKSGNYSILHHAFVCGPGYATPLGTFRTPYKARWNPLMGSYGQYCTQITGNFLFHSVPYYSMHENDLCYKLYNQLGTVCSHGCVRLTCADAKWIYDNCPLGTTVQIYDSSTLPVAKPKAPWLDITSPNRGWDPTDPNPNNPWKK